MDVSRYAALGAETRASQIKAELAEIYRAFPQLRRGQQGSAPSAMGQSANENGAGPARRRNRKPMTAAQKREVSRRMKAYWAKRRGEKKR